MKLLSCTWLFILLEVVPLCSLSLFSVKTESRSFLVVADIYGQVCVYSFLCSKMNLVSSRHSKCYSYQARG